MLLTSKVLFNLAEIGVGLIGFGIFFSFLGLILFFDRGLQALGNVRFFFLTKMSGLVYDMNNFLTFLPLSSDILVVRSGHSTRFAFYMTVIH